MGLTMMMEIQKCPQCDKESEILEESGGELFCPQCLKQIQKEIDRFDLYVLYRKRGKEWIDRQVKSFRKVKKGRKN
jgi:predicted amidophosphoribosyltransferase